MKPLNLALTLLLFSLPSLVSADEDDEQQQQLQPGLLASYRSSMEPDLVLQRIEAKPAFYVAEGSIHPRLPPGPFEATWRGMIVWNESEPVSFSAYISGRLSLRIDGELVLEEQSDQIDTRVGNHVAFERAPGTYPIEITYHSPPAGPARLQIWWESQAFSAEPLAGWHLQHIPSELPQTLHRDAQIEHGRTLVAQYGCGRCHRSAFPGVDDPAPGPKLTDVYSRTTRQWLLAWLANPAKLRDDAHMPVLFRDDPQGYLERWAISEYLLSSRPDGSASEVQQPGDHRMGRRRFVSLGCATCHYLPDTPVDEQLSVGQRAFVHLEDRWNQAALVKFLTNVHTRYEDQRMPQLPVDETAARDIAAYLLLWSTFSQAIPAEPAPPDDQQWAALHAVLGTSTIADAGQKLLERKGCIACHPDTMQPLTDIPIHLTDLSAGCLAGADASPKFHLTAEQRAAMVAYLTMAARETHASPFTVSQRQLERAQCVRCHQRDTDRPPPIEQIGGTLGGAWLQRIPYQRTPRLTFAHQKYEPAHLFMTVREGISGVRDAEFTYRMPSFGADAEGLVEALAVTDGDLPAGRQAPAETAADPTLGSLAGPELVGFQGYSCVGCHMWNGEMLASPDPAAIGPDLLRTVGRIRRPWFDRMLENPLRLHPGIPMPAVFPRGRPVLLENVLDGNPQRQRDALWNYFAMGSEAPHPKPAPAMAIAAPSPGEPPLVAQIPLHLDTGPIESLCLLYPTHDLIVIDLQKGTVVALYSGAVIERSVSGRIRRFHPASQNPPILMDANEEGSLWRFLDDKQQVRSPDRHEFLSYERRGDHVLLRRALHFGPIEIEVHDTLRLEGRQFFWSSELNHVPEAWEPERAGGLVGGQVPVSVGSPDFPAKHYYLPPAEKPEKVERAPVLDPGRPQGIFARPGYRATEFKIPQSESNEDLIMPSALAVLPNERRVLVASMKLGELFELTDPLGDGTRSTFKNYAHGLFQDAYSMTADAQGLYILHRRNLTRVRDTDADGLADKFERVAALPHGVADQYDYAYGLARDRSGGFVFSYAPYASRQLPGSGGAIRLNPHSATVEELAYGMRNPLGWCAGPDQEIFFTDNQGEWVATNKLCHIMPGHFYGFPNPDQTLHTEKPRGRTAVWVPYAWAHSINGVTYDNTEGRFGPFAGQFFLAELMFGGAIIRAQVERVNGQYQGACFPFWGHGLLGPVTLAFHPEGPLFVGSITEPGWMAQPDRGGLYRIDYTGEMPFEMQSIHILPQGFRIRFTRPVCPKSAADVKGYQIEHYRYEYTAAYGSPELDRGSAAIEEVVVAPDGMSVDVLTSPLITDRVYMIAAGGVRSAQSEPLVHSTGAYTLNELPVKEKGTEGD